MKVILYIKPHATVDRIAGYIGELPRKIDWEDVIERIEIERRKTEDE